MFDASGWTSSLTTGETAVIPAGVRAALTGAPDAVVMHGWVPDLEGDVITSARAGGVSDETLAELGVSLTLLPAPPRPRLTGDARADQLPGLLLLCRSRSRRFAAGQHAPEFGRGGFMAVAQTWNTTDLVTQDQAHLLHPVSNLHTLREQGPLVMVRGEDVFLWDSDGKRYIDAFAGLWNVNVGHGRTELADAATAQMREVAFVPTFFGLASPPPIELATRLAGLFPDPLNHFQFTAGGAEANETALKIARYYWWLQGQTDKVKILSRHMAYHGIAMGALSATGIPTYHEGFGPGVPGFVHLTAPHYYRNGDGLTEDEFVAALVRELEETIAREGAENIAAMIGEPVQGSGGVVVPPETYWAAIAPVLKAHNILLIFDEVICGFGRTGTMFGMQQYGVTPDIVSFAKGITSGYLPLGGAGVSDEIWDVLSTPDRMFMHGFTYSGHPVSCAVALPNLDIIKRERLPENAARGGAYLLGQLHDKLDDHSHVGNVRGKGLMLFVELVADKSTKERLAPSLNMSARLTKATRERGIIVRPVNDGIAISPPLTIQQPELDEIATVIAAAIDDVFP
jgi:4-aminobutyrate--pyruvate transaminase